MKLASKYAAGLTLAVLISGVQPLALAAVKAGQSCGKAGATSTSKGIKYTCMKSGKKLVWNKGVKIVPAVKTTPTPTPTKTPEVTSSPTPTPNSLQSWDNSERLDDLLKKFSPRTQQSSNFQPETIFEFGKGIDEEYKELILTGINAAAKFWSVDMKTSLKFPVIYAGVEDKEWFLSRIAFYGHSSSQYLAEVERRLQMEGAQANLAGLSFSNGTYLMQYLRGKGRTLIYAGEYGTSSHEYSHAAQTYFLKGKMDALPCWAMEGGANVYSNIILGLYLQNTKANPYVTRNSSIRDSQESGEYDLWKGTSDQLFSWVKLTEKQNSTQCTFPGKLGYSLGLLFYEQLLGKYGQSKAIAWMEGSAATNWQSAFESTYGLKVDDWYRNEAIPYLMIEIKKIRRDYPRY